MGHITSPLPDQARKVTGEVLQEALIDLIGLGLLGKQAHWTVEGREFRSLHLHLDEIVEVARNYADLVAERASAIGYPPDGLPRTLVQGSVLPDLPAGWEEDSAVVATFVDIHLAIVDRMRQRIAATESVDLVTQDLLLEVTAQLEKQHWMLQAQR